MFSEEFNMLLNMHFSCACGQQVYHLGETDFGCLHCDSACTIENCVACVALFAFEPQEYEEEEGEY